MIEVTDNAALDQDGSAEVVRRDHVLRIFQRESWQGMMID